MVRIRLLLAGAVVLASLISVGQESVADARGSSCSGWGASLGDCAPPTSGGKITDGGVDVWAHDSGSSGGHGSRNNSGRGGGNGTPAAQPTPTSPDPNLVLDPDCPDIPMQVCMDNYTVTGPESVDIRDLARFLAASPSDHMQPKGWMIVGLDTNFYASANVQVVSGEVLDSPASVRFTPVAYHWDYGDGSTADRATSGSTWGNLGMPEFSPTATSHVYRKSGTYTITLSVYYAAQYRFDGQRWARVRGTLRMPANTLTATAGDAKTVLVNRDCTRAPGGPGC